MIESDPYAGREPDPPIGEVQPPEGGYRYVSPVKRLPFFDRKKVAAAEPEVVTAAARAPTVASPVRRSAPPVITFASVGTQTLPNPTRGAGVQTSPPPKCLHQPKDARPARTDSLLRVPTGSRASSHTNQGRPRTHLQSAPIAAGQLAAANAGKREPDVPPLSSGDMLLLNCSPSAARRLFTGPSSARSKSIDEARAARPSTATTSTVAARSILRQAFAKRVGGTQKQPPVGVSPAPKQVAEFTTAEEPNAQANTLTRSASKSSTSRGLKREPSAARPTSSRSHVDPVVDLKAEVRKAHQLHQAAARKQAVLGDREKARQWQQKADEKVTANPKNR